jgi:hypothetical protein
MMDRIPAPWNGFPQLSGKNKTALLWKALCLNFLSIEHLIHSYLI